MNNGDFDLNAMLTFGVNAKNANTAIGQFGTGFKYAVAIILRLNGSIKVTTSGVDYVFTTITKKIRGKKFDIVLINGEKTGFTTHLGYAWEPWKAYRELYCNAKDENGIVSLEIDTTYDTIVSVECSAFTYVHENRKKYFLHGTPICCVNSVEFFDNSCLQYFYQGIAVYDCKESVYSYNLLRGVELTEDRTAKYPHIEIEDIIAGAIQQSNDKKFIRKILTSSFKRDKEMRYDITLGDPSAEFLNTCRELIATNIGIPEYARRVLIGTDEKSGNWPKFELTDVQKIMLERAIEFLFKLNINVAEFPIYAVVGLGQGIMGRALEGNIYISEIAFQMGTKQVASTLLEEWVHNKYGCDDFDRNMQNWLFDKILSMGEDHTGTPL